MHFGPGALAAAFAAGFVSFVSPCVLPLIPGYLSFVSGVSFDELGDQQRRGVASTMAFVGGFAGKFALPRALLSERHASRLRREGGLGGAGLTGVAFAIGWTPCTGPTLAAIFALAAGGSATSGAILLAVYALGLGVPFLLAGLFFTKALTASRWLRAHWRVVGLASGSLLVLFGVLLASGELVQLTTRLARFTGLQI